MKALWSLASLAGLIWILAQTAAKRESSPARPAAEAEESPAREALEIVDLTSGELRALERWLRDRQAEPDSAGPPRRDPFQEGRPGAPPPSSASVNRGDFAPATGESLAAPGEEEPLLKGFLFRGEEKGSRLPLAAIRFAGKMWLAGEGDAVGRYRVDQIVVGEQVTLIDSVTGERTVLSIR